MTWHRESARLHFEQSERAICGAGGKRFVAKTTNESQVDCERCRKIISRPCAACGKPIDPRRRAVLVGVQVMHTACARRREG